MSSDLLISGLSDIVGNTPLPIAIIRKETLEFPNFNDEFCSVFGLNLQDSFEEKKIMLEGLFALDAYPDFISGESPDPIVFHKKYLDKEETELTAVISSKTRTYGNEQIVFLSVVHITSIKNSIVASGEGLNDSFTGCYNKVYLDEFLGREISRTRRLKHNLSLAMIDIDDLTGVNETYGHLAGDEVIKNLAMLLHDLLRKTDILFRYEGEKFLALLNDCEKNEAFSKIEDIRKRFEAIEIEYEGIAIKSSFSAGISTFPVHSMDKHEIIWISEMALKDAKKNGKNKVMVYGKK